MSHINKSVDLTELSNGSYKFDVIRYSLIKRISVGTCITSNIFHVGGHEWLIEFYPAGYNEVNGDCVGAYIRLVDSTIEAKAMFDLSLELKDRPGVYSSDGQAGNSSLCSFTNASPCCGNPRFITKAALEAHYVKNDSFQIRCSLWVLKEARTAANDVSSLRDDVHMLGISLNE